MSHAKSPLYLHLDQPDERVRMASAECSSDDAETDAMLYGQMRMAAFLVIAGLLGYVGWVVLG